MLTDMKEDTFFQKIVLLARPGNVRICLFSLGKKLSQGLQIWLFRRQHDPDVSQALFQFISIGLGIDRDC